MRMRVRIDEGGFMPSRAHDIDAGLDLRAVEGGIVPAGGSAVFRTGVHVELPAGSAGILVSKSGLNINSGITSTGLIDEGFTGEILVKLYNQSSNDYQVQYGDKISQLVVIPALYVEPVETLEELSTTGRGTDGYGSTGR